MYDKISGKKYKRVGIVAAKVGEKIVAPMEYDGTMDSLLFETWFEHSFFICGKKRNSYCDGQCFHCIAKNS